MKRRSFLLTSVLVPLVLAAPAAALPPTVQLGGSVVKINDGPWQDHVDEDVRFWAWAEDPDDPNGDGTFTYEWSVSDGTPVSSATPDKATVRFTTLGERTITLKVTDGDGEVTSESTTFVVLAKPAPQAKPQPQPLPQTSGTTTTTTPVTPAPAPAAPRPATIGGPPPGWEPPLFSLSDLTKKVRPDGRVTLSGQCWFATGSCHGTVVIRTAKPVKPALAAAKKKGRAAKRAKAQKAKVVELGRGTFAVPKDTPWSTTLVLSRAGRDVLASAKRVPVIVTVAVRDDAGRTVTQTPKVTFTAVR